MELHPPTPGRNRGPIHREGLPLTRRQREVLAGLVAGQRQHEIAEQLGIKKRSVQTHLEHAKRRLGARTTMQAVAMAGTHDNSGETGHDGAGC